jgi:hypothetical protein
MKSDNNKRLITLTMITLSGFHCSLTMIYQIVDAAAVAVVVVVAAVVSAAERSVELFEAPRPKSSART